MKLLPGQGLMLTTSGVWGRAAISGGMAAGAELVAAGLGDDEGLADGEPDAGADGEAADGDAPGEPAAPPAAAGLAGAALGAVLAAGLPGVTGGYVNPAPPPVVQAATISTVTVAAASLPAERGEGKRGWIGGIARDGINRRAPRTGRFAGQ